MKILYSFVLFFILFSSIDTKSFEIKALAKVNSQVISNYDLFVEIKLQELLNNRSINKSRHRQILQRE